MRLSSVAALQSDREQVPLFDHANTGRFFFLVFFGHLPTLPRAFPAAVRNWVRQPFYQIRNKEWENTRF
jgi:hypothetical protein